MTPFPLLINLKLKKRNTEEMEERDFKALNFIGEKHKRSLVTIENFK